MKIHNVLFVALIAGVIACNPSERSDKEEDANIESENQPSQQAAVGFTVEGEAFTGQSGEVTKTDSAAIITAEGWVSYTIEVPETGRYRVVADIEGLEGLFWIEDYIDNPDGRSYNVTGFLNESRNIVDGTPLAVGTHNIKFHADKGELLIDKVAFTLIRKHEVTPVSLTQNTEGENWSVVWSDEFDGDQIDDSKWSYDVGDWGWGNNELQYYTVSDTKNARVENGHLIIEALKNENSDRWTSARLTTRGKTSFLYGKIEFMAKVPREKGNWAAGWTLGDDYVDEKSWPYCGEIDIMESVGYEVNNETGDGIAHCTVHTPAYYFKINNQISSTKEIIDIADSFHTYAVEWTPTEVKGFVDGEHYYTYDKTANDKEWPFNKPQNIILNLAMGGGWGGAQGMDSTITSQKLIIDYVRVYEKK